MSHTLVCQRYAKTILLVFVLLVLLAVSAAAENIARVNAQAAATSTQDAARNTQHAVRRASRTIRYTYDNAGRLTNVNYVGAQPIAYTYDAAGNLTQRQEAGPEIRVYLPLMMKQTP